MLNSKCPPHVTVIDDDGHDTCTQCGRCFGGADQLPRGPRPPSSAALAASDHADNMLGLALIAVLLILLVVWARGGW